MNIYYLKSQNSGFSISTTRPERLDGGFIWIDCLREEVRAAPEMWQNQVHAITDLFIDEYHVADILNIHHPSAFDLTDEYEILIFRKILTDTHDAPIHALDTSERAAAQPLNPSDLHTTPAAFVWSERAIVTVHDGQSPIFQQMQQRFGQWAQLESSQSIKSKGLPIAPIDLCLKLLNSMIDKYLNLRAPLTAQIEFWQNELLQSKKPFSQWSRILQESVALQQLESLCEEQIDALQELRDEFVDVRSDDYQHQRRDLMLVRINDLIEHAHRVQSHAARLALALKSAVDLHFSASANQTNETMRFLTIMTAVFAPLTLLTGVYGMNFDVIPGLHNPRGFWFLLGAMIVVTLGLLLFFQRLRFVNRSEKTISQLLSGEQDA